MKYFKIVWGYNAEDYVQIDETELEKAYYAHLTKKDAVFSGGSVSGDKIIAIKEDFHRAMGWNRGYKLSADDFAELSQKGIDRNYQKFLFKTKERVHYLIETKQTHLIGKNAVIPELEQPKNGGLNDEIKQLGDKFKIG